MSNARSSRIPIIKEGYRIDYDDENEDDWGGLRERSRATCLFLYFASLDTKAFADILSRSANGVFPA